MKFLDFEVYRIKNNYAAFKIDYDKSLLQYVVLVAFLTKTKVVAPTKGKVRIEFFDTFDEARNYVEECVRILGGRNAED